MRKIVINSCHGGFNLSDEALEWLVTNKGWDTTTFSKDGWLNNKDAKILVYDKSFFGKYHLNDDSKFRDDKDVIEAIETLGSKRASGPCSQLTIVEIPDDVEWEIQEYDGAEWVAEKHRTWQ